MTDAMGLVEMNDYVTEWMDTLRFVDSCFKRFSCDWVTRDHHAVFVGKPELVFKAGVTTL
jgi:hypothetical protein